MIVYTATDLAKGLQRAHEEGIRLRESGYRLRYRSTASSNPNGPYVYDIRLTEDLTGADCTCPASGPCKHGAAAISAARLRAARDAARTMRQYQLWRKAIAA